MDSVYLFCYAFGNYASGMLGDRYPLRYFVPIGMYLSALGYGIMILLAYLDCENVWAFIVLWAWQGIAQSTVWPGTVAVMGNWFGKAHRGSIMGLWSANASVGDIVGAQIAALVLTFNGKWELVMLITMCFIALIATLFLIFVRDRPEQILDQEDLQLVRLGDETQEDSVIEKNNRMGLFRAWMLPGVFIYSITYACVKLLNYGLIMWLPYFFDQVLDVSGEALGGLANVYDAGGIAGSFFFGWVSDRYGYRTPIIECMLIAGIPMLALFNVGNSSILGIYYMFSFVTGVFISGAANLISGAVSADLGKNENISSKDEVISTVTGIIDGTGSVGAGIGTFVLGGLANLGWFWPFLFLMCVAVIAICLLLPMTIRDFRRAKRETKGVSSSE